MVFCGQCKSKWWNCETIKWGLDDLAQWWSGYIKSIIHILIPPSSRFTRAYPWLVERQELRSQCIWIYTAIASVENSTMNFLQSSEQMNQPMKKSTKKIKIKTLVVWKWQWCEASRQSRDIIFNVLILSLAVLVLVLTVFSCLVKTLQDSCNWQYCHDSKSYRSDVTSFNQRQ
jgi:hypothetical protein